jgi:pimeloyl-ACP methyl ester carboxylesterase
VRSLTRPSGIRFQRLLDAWRRRAHRAGARRARHLPAAVDGEGSEAWVRAPYSLQVLEGVGHFCHEEAPEEVTATLLELLTR